MSRFPDMPPDPTRWRQLTLVTVLVLLVHAGLLVSLPPWGARDATPPQQRFITRTIVVAPPAPAEPPAPPAAAEPTPAEASKPAPAPVPRKAPAHRAATPHPPPQEQEAPPPAPVLATPDTSAEQARNASAPPIESPPAGEPAPVNEAGTPGGTAAIPGGAEGPGGDGEGDAASLAAGRPRPGQSLPVHSSVRLNFEMVAQRGVQPWKGVFGELVWLQDGSEYNARLSLKVLFKTIRSQTSEGRIDASGIAPRRFSETRKNEVASRLVREDGKVVFGNDAPSVPLLPGAQDRLSVVMQLGALLGSDPARYPEGSRIAIQTVGPREAGVWTFVVGGTERIAVPSGEYETRRLSREPRTEHDYKLELWLAPELGWLPARMRQTQQDGDVIDLQLRDVSTP